MEQFPDLYKKGGTRFIQFMEAYFEWMEETNNPLYYVHNLWNFRDIDKTIDNFIIHFKEKYLSGIQFETTSNKRLFVKHALEFWRSKGSKRAVDLLFQLVYGASAEIFYPKEDILRVSDSDFTIPIYLEVSDSPLNSQFINRQIQGINSKATAYVERYVKKKVGSIPINIFYLSNIVGNFKTGELIQIVPALDINKIPHVKGSLTSLVVLSGGFNFHIGDIVELINPDGILQGKARVTGINTILGTVSLNLIDGGFGYPITTPIILSDNVLLLNNVNTQNQSFLNGFEYFEQIYQPSTNVSANVMGISSNCTLFIGIVHTHAWASGLVVSQNAANGIVASGVISNVGFSGGDTILSVVNTVGSFSNVGNSVILSYPNTTIIAPSGGVLLRVDTNIGIINATGVFVINQPVIGLLSNTTATVTAVSTGVGASFKIANLINQETVTLYDDFMHSNNSANVPFSIIKLNGSNSNVASNGYGFPHLPSGNINSIIGNCLNTTSTSIGTIGGIQTLNPGNNYNVQPFILIREPRTTNEKDYLLTVDNSNFLNNEKVEQVLNSTSIVIGSIKTVSNNVLSVRRLTYENSFQLSGNTINGLNSGISANIISISDDFSSNTIGWNASIQANVNTLEGTVNSLQVIDSGLGYVNNENVIFQAANGDSGIAGAVVSTQGIGEGFYVSTSGFLSNSKVIQDGSYYQDFSYEVRTSIPFSVWGDMFKRVMHVAGTALFSAVYIDSNNQIEVSVSNNYSEIVSANVSIAEGSNNYNANGILNLIPTIPFSIGDTVTQSNTMTGIVKNSIAQIVINGSNSFYEVGQSISQNIPNTVTIGANGYLSSRIVNTTSNQTTLFVSNVTGTFANSALTNTTPSNVYGVTARAFNWSLTQRFNLASVFNSDPTTGSFTKGETVFKTGTTIKGTVIGANSTFIDINNLVGTFNIGASLVGSISGATALINDLSNTVFTVGANVAQQGLLVELQGVQGLDPVTGSFNIGEVVVQKQKNINSQNGITSNTFVGQVQFANSSFASLGFSFGNFSNNQPLYGVNSGSIATVNHISTTNLAQGVISLANSSVIQITNVTGTFTLNYVITSIGANLESTTIAAFTSILPNIISQGVVNSIINTITFDVISGETVITTNSNTNLIDANTSAQASVVAMIIETL